MSTRLYPRTKDPFKLELLAGVRPGTHARLAELEAMKPEFGPARSADEQAWFDLVSEDPDLNALYHLELFGFGRLRFGPEDVGFEFDPVCGHTDNPYQIAKMLLHQGVEPHVTVELCEGLGWS